MHHHFQSPDSSCGRKEVLATLSNRNPGIFKHQCHLMFGVVSKPDQKEQRQPPFGSPTPILTHAPRMHVHRSTRVRVQHFAPQELEDTGLLRKEAPLELDWEHARICRKEPIQGS